MIYTTNAIESINARFRVVTRPRGHFPDEQSAPEVFCLAVPQRGTSSRGFDRNPGGRVNNWKSVLNVLLLTNGDRLTDN